MFSFYSTSDKVMAIIMQSKGMPAKELIDTIKSRLHLSTMEIDSTLADLSKQNLIATMYADGELYALEPQPYALSQLKTKREVKIFTLQWDLIKLLLGYVLGFVSAWLLK